VSRLLGLVAGGLRSARRRGVRTTAHFARQELERHLYVRDVHLWYALATQAERPAFELKPHLRFVRGGPDDARRLVELPTVSPETARRRMQAGAELYLVLDDQDRAILAAWLFEGATPVLAAPGGMLALPPGVASLEDTVTSPLARGQGVAPAAWSRMADALAARGVGTMVTTVHADNAPTHRAVGKVGFAEYAAVRYTRLGPRRRVEVWTDGGALGEHLRTAIRADAPAGPSPVALPAAR
jgi:GNAT superfamily N-acetyltransferase